jgi:hypothetical protein
MSLAIFILAHKNAAQVARLVQAVHRPEHVVVLHFDKRSDRSLHQLGRDLAKAHSNVVVLRSRTILWGGYEMAAVQIEAMATTLRLSRSWHHFINLTGQDFPIKPPALFEAHLQQKPDANYVSWFDPVFTPHWSNARERLDRYYLEWPWLERALRLPGIGRRLRTLLGLNNRLPHVPYHHRKWPDFRYYGGSNHIILSRAGCEYMTTDPEARRIAKWLKHSAHANEIIFQTVMLNSPLASTVVNTHLREVEFEKNSPHPRTFKSADFDRLVRSPKFFARKFDASVDSAILDRLAEHCGLAVSPAPGATVTHS